MNANPASVDSRDAATAAPSILSRLRWPVIVALLLGGHTLLVVVGVVAALADPAAYATPPGYADAGAWDERRAEQRASDALGWTLEITPRHATELDGSRRVRFEFLDRNGGPVPIERLHLRAYHYAAATRVLEVELPDVTRGAIEPLLPLRRAGQWRVEVVAESAGDRFVANADVWIDSAENAAPMLKSR
jgi:nitrogen fixation protein FixH